MDQPQESVFIRVNGEILESLINQTSANKISKGMILAKFLDIDQDKGTATIESTDSKHLKFSVPKDKFNSINKNNYYQICFTFEYTTTIGVQGVVLSLFDFGPVDSFDTYSYSLTYFNYWNIIKDRYPQLKTESDQMDQQY
ncbi:hypothetical protein DDB_G0284115 [Dictyostelium discoideum AX4]|uniref:Uncharacterized protein n=1 Tax=Dictyostelium discoideum TaxID=44689 RepID=Q54Q32_DICDI|nr:hypothetical protein DDB_G0284115 [Dictyostelium discoideum AX4]EAL65398.1 hypothetical protein DDB_G0284115 [Dictyostelium discoideum AX4]|eukprot:XP_638765.1 hypothetical protein DDB_G0284115 [Dictyostelium discoideum AX4]